MQSAAFGCADQAARPNGDPTQIHQEPAIILPFAAPTICL